VFRIAAKRRNVVLHPLESGDLIEKTTIAGGVMRRFPRELGMGEEAEDVGTVVDGHGDDTLVAMLSLS